MRRPVALATLPADCFPSYGTFRRRVRRVCEARERSAYDNKQGNEPTKFFLERLRILCRHARKKQRTSTQMQMSRTKVGQRQRCSGRCKGRTGVETVSERRSGRWHRRVALPLDAIVPSRPRPRHALVIVERRALPDKGCVSPCSVLPLDILVRALVLQTTQV